MTHPSVRVARWRRFISLLRRRGSAAPRGQSMVEFALVLPLLLILLLGVADFGRVMSAGITTEAAARNAGEMGAIERLRNKPPSVIDPGFAAYYDALHLAVAKVACSEMSLQPNTTFDSVNRTCSTLPVIRVCVHDDLDPSCGAPIPGFADPVPAECPDMVATWSNASGGDIGSHSVEVRVCYRFTTLFNLHLSLPMEASINVGDIWLQRTRHFVLDCPPGSVASC